LTDQIDRTKQFVCSRHDAEISARARNAVVAAAKRIPRAIHLSEQYWQRVIDNNPLITEALEHQGSFTLGGTARFRSRKFNMKAFCKDLSAVAFRAIQTGQFVDRELVESLTLLAVRDAGEFAKFLSSTAPKQSYLAARPHAEVVEPREAVNPGEHRRPAIPEWVLGYDLKLGRTPVPRDEALTPEEAYHEVCGSPVNRTADWDWKFDSKERRFRAIALRPKTPAPEWTLRSGTPVPVDPTLSPAEVEHTHYGSPLYPGHGWTWEWNGRTQRFLPSIYDEPNRRVEPRFQLPKPRHLYRWHSDDGHYSLLRADDDDWEEYENDLYEYDSEEGLFKRYQPDLDPLTPLKPRSQEYRP
jgi:hypothetical protein